MGTYVSIPKIEPGEKHGWFSFGKVPMLSCMDCGKQARMARHNVSEDGTVHPSIVCPFNGCTSHIWGKLEDWDGGAIKGKSS